MAVTRTRKRTARRPLPAAGITLEDYRRFCKDFDVQIVVLSRDRAEVLAKCTDRLVQEYVLFHCGEGYDEHEYHCTQRIEVSPMLEGRSAVANHALRTLPNKVVIILGDDIKAVHWLGEDKAQYLGREGFMVMTVNLVINAIDLNVGLFGVSNEDIRKNSPLAPFHFRSMVTGFAGINRNVRPDQPIWFDERQKLKEDYDFCLEFLKRDRLVLKDLRYFISHDIQQLAGGNMRFRSPAREELEVQNLRRWWGEDMITWNPNGRRTTTKHLRIVV